MDDPRVTGAETSQESQLTPFGARTFLGGGRVSARLRWFVVLCAVALAVMGSLYFYAETLLARADRQTAEAAAVQRYTLEIEKSVWRLRGTEKDFILSGDPRHIGVYDSIAKSAGNSLGSLESLGASKPIKEHIATVNDGIAQHAAAFQQLVEGQNADTGGQTESQSKKLETSARALESQLSRIDIASLTQAFAQMRRSEARFKSTGAIADLRANSNQREDFTRLLASAAVSKQDRATVERLMTAYQADMTALAKVTLSRTARISRLDEIFSYLLPSLNGIAEFAGRHGISAREETARLQRLARTAALAGGGGVILLLLAGGLILMQSLAAPLRDMAESADKLVYGQQDVALPALGNRDEIGEVARALNVLRVTLGELSQATEELTRTRVALEAAQRDAQEARAAAQSLEAKARDAETNAQVLRHQAQEAAAQAQAQIQALQTQARQSDAAVKAAEAKLKTAETKARTLETQAKEAQDQARAAQDQMRTAQARATEAQNKAAAAERALAQAKTAEPARDRPADQKPAAPAAPDGAPGSSPEHPLSPQPIVSGKNALTATENAETPIDAIASLSQYLAQSSRNVSDAAFEAERTSALIRGLNDAESHLEKIDPLIRLIGKQTDFLISPPARQQSRPGDTHGNLVALSSARNAPKDGIGLGDEEIRKRFETIRKAAIQVLQSVRAVAQTVHLSKGSALEIAAASSADALEITTDLLEQSEHLRGMLNDLIGKLHSTSLPAPKETKPAPKETKPAAQAKKPAPKLSAQAVKKPAPKPPQK